VVEADAVEAAVVEADAGEEVLKNYLPS